MYQLSILIHLLAATVWVGGMLFLALVAVPATRGLPPAERGALIGALGRRFRVVGWACVALLIVAGAVNTAYRGVTWETVASGRLLEGEFGRLLALKLTVVVAMVAVTTYHDFVVGPASLRLLERHAGRDPAATAEVARLRRRASWLARLGTLLALLILALAVALVRGLPW